MADIKISDIRRKFPEYGDLDDSSLAEALHARFYSDMDRADFFGKVGVTAPEPKPQTRPAMPQTPPAQPAMPSAPQDIVAMMRGVNAPAAAPMPKQDLPPVTSLRPMAPGQTPPVAAQQIVPATGEALLQAMQGPSFGQQAYRQATQPSGAPMQAAPPQVTPPAPPMAMPSPAMPSGQSIPGNGQSILDAMQGKGIGWQQYQQATNVPGAPPAAKAVDPFADETFGDLATRRGQEVAQGASGVFQSIVRARGINDKTLFDAIKRDAPKWVKEAARQVQSFEDILAKGLSDDGQSPMTPQERATYTQRLDQATEAVAQWSDTAEFGPVFAGYRTQKAERTADALKDWTDKTFGVPPQDDSLWSDLFSGAGSVVAFMVPPIVAGPYGAVVTAQMGADVAKTEAYDRAKQSGASERDAQTAAAIAGFMGTSEAIPLWRALGRLPDSVRGDILGRLGRFASATFKGSIEEGIQEGGLAIGQNLIALGVYDPEQDIINKDVGKQALVGAILGGLMGGGANALGRSRDRDEETTTPAAAPTATPEAAPEAAPQDTPEMPLDPDAPDRYELLPEIEGQGDQQRETGRTVRFDTQTGAVEVVDDGATETPESVPVLPGADQGGAVDADMGPGSRPAENATAGQQADIATPTPSGSGGPESKFLTSEEMLSLETDASIFQYKSGGDESGVTDRLQGVRNFDPARAGQAMLYRTKDGRLIVADGHQRVGLAKRAAESGQADVGGMPALIYNETDGYTAKEVMSLAALKNIGEGTGTALDAARVLRDRNESIEDLGLPPKSALVRDAEGLRRLSGDAFGMVANNVASDRDGSVVGRVVKDQAVQADILGMLTTLGKKQSINAAQAEMIARDAAANTATETQTDMFGSEQVAQSLYLERAKVLDGAVKDLRKNKSAFNTLLKNGEAIEGAGNTLDQNANEAQVQQDAKVLEYIQRQANMKGPISDALTKAARAVKSGEPVARARRAFLRDIIGSLQGTGAGGQEGQAGGGAGGQLAPQGGQAQAPEVTPEQDAPAADPFDSAEASLFGNTEQTPEGEQGVMPGFERDSDTNAAAVKAAADAKAKAQADTRKNQSKIGTTTPQDDGGPLFNAQSDIEDGGGRDTDADPRAKMTARLDRYREPGEKLPVVSRDYSTSADSIAFLADMEALPTMEARKARADEFVLAEGKATGVEILVALDVDGLPLEVISGDRGSVDPSYALYRAANAGLVGYVTHNHPSNRGFSPADITIMGVGFPEVRAMGHKGAVSTARKGPGYKAADKWDDKAAFGARKDVVNRVHQVLFQHFLPQVKGGTLSADVADAVHGHIFNLILHRHGVIDFSGNSAQIVEKESIDVREVFKATDAKVRAQLGRAGFDVTPIRDRGPDQADGRDGEAGRPAPAGRGGTGSTPQNSQGGDGNGRVSGPEVTDFDAAEAALFGAESDKAEGPAATDAAPIQMTPPPARAPRKPSKSADASALNNLFGKKPGGLKEDTASFDDDTYAATVPIFARNIEGFDLDAMSDTDAYIAMARPLLAEGLTRETFRAMRPYFERFLADARSGKIDLTGETDAQAPGGSVERDSGNAGSQDQLGGSDVSPAAGRPGRRDGGRNEAADQGGRQRDGGAGLPGRDADAVGGTSGAGVQGDGRPSGRRPDRDGDGADGGDRSQPGLRPDDSGSDQTRKTATNSPDRVTNTYSPPTRHHAEVAKSVPQLQPAQVDDVVRIERRLFRPEDGKKQGFGMLITNGVGTGKTFTGLGAAKRAVDRGAKAVLVVVRSAEEARNWVESAPMTGLDAAQMDGVSDNGEGRGPVLVTTYANLANNETLADREWDLVIADEAHTLSQNKAGEQTGALRTLRAISNKPTHLFDKELMKRRDAMAKARAITNKDRQSEAMAAVYQEARDAAKKATAPRSNVLFMSATPFSYEKNTDYGEGYLFDYPKDERREGSDQGGREWFMVENFGYRIRYHKLTQPEAAVDRGVFQREFHERLKREGSLWGRKLEVDVDYDRKFVAVENKIGSKIDEAIAYIWKKQSEERAALQAAIKDSTTGQEGIDAKRVAAMGWEELGKAVNRNFTYLKRQQLLEAMKAEAAIPDIRKHLAMGRKVVVFHDFNVGGATSPFKVTGTEDLKSARMQMERDLPWLNDLDFGSLTAPKDQIMEAFGDQAREFNGTISKGKRSENKDAFNLDGSGVDVLVVQSDAGSGGISLHDTTGGHQRVMINLGMPTKPTTSLQAEGRTRRVGSVSNAPYRYYTIGTAWEREAFARRIAEQSGAVENLAMGNEARAIQQAFVDAYTEADRNLPSSSDGIGGRARDSVDNTASEFDKAKTHYYGRQKMKGKRDQRKGLDFFPTPEPLALKMVEWAGVRPYDKVLEPSAGDGAIARYFPGHADRTIVEPSADLSSRAELLAPGSRVVNDTFENLNIVNKYDVVVMNPPFGSGGKTAYDHLLKAMQHTRPGGRVVALVPTGPAADKQFGKLMDRIGKTSIEWNLSADVSLPSVTFERAGTAVAARVLIFDRVMKPEAFTPAANINMTGSGTIADFFERLEGIAGPARPDRIGPSGVEADMDAADAADAAAQGDTGTRVTAPVSSDPGAQTMTTVTSRAGKVFPAVAMESRVDKGQFVRLNAVAKTHGGWWHKAAQKRGKGPTFAFRSEDARKAFIEDIAKPVQGFEDANPIVEPIAAEQRPAATGTAMDRDAASAMLPALRAELDRLNLKRVGLDMDVPGANRQGAMRANGMGQIDVLIGQAINPMATLYHEAIHAMRAMNLFTKEEWSALEAAAKRGWVEKHDIRARYPDLLPSEMIEEAIAEEFAQRAASRSAPQGSLLVRAFNKIHRMLKAIRNAMRGEGFTTAESVFGKVIAGQIGARNAESASIASLMEQRNPPMPRIRPTPPGPPPPGPLPVHVPDRVIWDELTRSGVSVFGRIRGVGAAIYDNIDKARFNVQDRFLPVLRAQQAIEADTGRPVPNHLNAYATETTFSGKAGRHLFVIDEDFTKPIIDIIAKTNGGLTTENVGDWLAARHAKERNARIASINLAMPDGGSGITDADADAYLAQMASGAHQAELDQIGDLVDELRERTLKLRRDAGLLSAKEYVIWKNQYAHYVPLQGFDESDGAEATLDARRTGPRYNVRGPESMRAMGRNSMAFNPLISAITQAKEVSIRAEKNRVSQALYELAKAHPSDAMWSVKKPKQKRFYNRTTGLVETRVEQPANSRLEPNEFAIKIQGHEHRIVLHDDRLANALGAVGADQLNGVVRVLGAYTRYKSMILTMLNPEFVVTNALRDFQAAQINLPQMTDSKGFGAAVSKTWGKAFMGSFKGMGNQENTVWTRHWKEFEEAGAKISFWTLDNPTAGTEDMSRRIDLARGNRAARILKVATRPRAFFSTRDNVPLGMIERTNIAVDNAIRLASYVEARKRGWSKQDAALLAKNLTVNFNRRGNWTWLNAMFLFFNAAIQGLQVFLSVFTSKYGLAVGASLLSYGLMEDLVNASLSATDDDDELAYDKIPDYQSRRNFLFMVRQGEDGVGGVGQMDDAVSVPMPYVYSVFPYAGRQIGKVFRGVKTADEAMLDVAIAAASDVSPLGFTDPADMVTPILLKDIMEFRNNENWLGNPIRPEYDFSDYGPMAYKHYVGVSEMSRQVADYLNRETGGNAAQSGWLDVSPEYIDHAIGTATGSAGTFWTDTIDVAVKAATGKADLIDDRAIPFLPKVTVTTGVWMDRRAYYDRLSEVRDAHSRKKQGDDAGEPVDARYKILDRMYTQANRINRQVSGLNRERMKARLDKSLDDRARMAEYERIEKAQQVLYVQFNKEFLRLQKLIP